MLCAEYLSYTINQALACAKPLTFSPEKDKLILFGAIHLFVLSGFHLFLIKVFLQIFLKKQPALILFILLFYTALCGFSAPLLRAFFHCCISYGKNNKYLHCSLCSTICLSTLLSFPAAFITNSWISLFLSFLFSFLISYTRAASFFTLTLYLLSLPLYIAVLGIPHLSQTVLIPIFSFVVGFIMTPLALFSLFFSELEQVNLYIWWKLIDVLDFFKIFFNLTQNNSPDFSKQNLLLSGIAYFFILTLIFILGIKWKRHSYSF